MRSYPYGKIYAGNVKRKDVNKMLDGYTENYKQDSYKGNEAHTEDIIVDDIFEEFANLKEIAGGLGQRTSADL